MRTVSYRLWLKLALSLAIGLTLSSGARVSQAANAPLPEMETTAALSIIPPDMSVGLGAYDPGQSLASTSTISIDHFFVSWDAATSWAPGTNQQTALQSSLNHAAARGRRVLVTVEPWSVSGLSSGSLLQDVVAGKYDANIQWVCAALGSYGKPVLVRWGHEMENVTGRYPWASRNSAAYISAYRYFTDKCRSLAPDISLVWSPTGNRELVNYWPGAAYVDYVGLSTYDFPAWEIGYYGVNRSFDQNFGERYGYVKGYAKPVIIAEFGATGDTKDLWLADALASLSKYPLLSSVVFFDAQDPAPWGTYAAPDWRIAPDWLVPPG